MLLRIVIFLLMFALNVKPLEAGIIDLIQNTFSKETPPRPPSIRVLLAHDQPGVILEVKGNYKIFDPRTNQHITSNYQGKRRYIQALSDGIRWGEEFPGVHQIVIVPDKPDITTIVDGIEYRGAIYVYDVGGTISIVNQVDIEDYLYSTLPQRYTKALPEEVMDAVAIAARTNSYYQAQHGKTAYWDVDAEKVGYKGSALTGRAKDVEKGIRNTQYMILYRIGKGDWAVTPFAADWRPGSGGKVYPDVTYSEITLEEAVSLTKKGKGTVHVLDKAFPGASIKLMHYSQG